MLVMLAAALVVLAGGSVLQAREAFAVGNHRGSRLWSAVSLPLLLLSVAAIWFLVREPKLLWWMPPTGFGVDWRCQDNVPPSVSVCFKH